MRTCSAPIPDPIPADRTGGVPVQPKPAVWQSPRARRRAFVLVEMIVVVSILALFVLIAQMNLFGTLRRSRFKANVQEFVSAMQMAISSAAENGRRYGMVINLNEQTFLLHQIISSDLDVVLDEEIILEGQFGETCRIAYVEFDFGTSEADTFVNEGKATFVAGHAGWFYGGKIVFIDESEQMYSVIISRITPIVALVEGEPALMRPKAKDEVPFL